MERHPQSPCNRRLTWVCSLIVLVTSCAGAIHFCGVGFSTPTVHNQVASDTAPSHTFCAICSLVHSPSVLGAQFGLLPSSNPGHSVSGVFQARATLSETFALCVRPPPSA